MSEAFEKFLSFIRRHSMLDGATGVLIAVSGGPDSVALLDMLCRVSGVRLCIAHMDHMLRGRASAEDARFVRELARRLAIPVVVASVDVRGQADRLGRGIEEVARELRYDFLLATARAAGCDRISTGHTMTDQAETFLMRLARGAGMQGLRGMRPVLPAHSFAHSFQRHESEAREEKGENTPLLIRPLLCLTREQVEAYCGERGLEFRIDPTNEGLDYARNRVRHKVLPALGEINPRVVEHIARTCEINAGDQQVLDQLACSLLDKAARSGPEISYSVLAFEEQPPGLRRRMIIEAIRRARLRPGASEPRRAEIGSAHVAAVEQLLAERPSGRRLCLPGGLEAWREFDSLVLRPASGATGYEFEISSDTPLVAAGGLTLCLSSGLAGHLLKECLDEARREKSVRGRDWMMAVLDGAALPASLVVRGRRSGERAKVLGHVRTKKLKKLMIDHRIPPSRRAIWPVVVTPDGRYVWSPGLPPAVEFAARDETQCLAILRASDA